MRLRCRVGRYAGQIQDYSPFAGMSALRTGMAERVTDAVRVPAPIAEPVPVGATPMASAPAGFDAPSRKRKK